MADKINYGVFPNPLPDAANGQKLTVDQIDF